MNKYAIILILALSQFCYAGSDLASRVSQQLHKQPPSSSSPQNVPSKLIYGGQDISRPRLASVVVAHVPSQSSVLIA